MAIAGFRLPDPVKVTVEARIEAQPGPVHQSSAAGFRQSRGASRRLLQRHQLPVTVTASNLMQFVLSAAYPPALPAYNHLPGSTCMQLMASQQAMSLAGLGEVLMSELTG